MEPLAVLAAPVRLEILRLTWEDELSSGQIAERFDITWGAVSQHIAVLRAAGYLSERRAGNHRFYRADPTALGVLRVVVETHWRDSLDRLKAAAEEAGGEVGGDRD